MTDNYLIEGYNLDLFSFTVPKKYNNSMICKIKNDSNDVLIQFPKMNVTTEENNVVELEFKNEKGYNKKIYDFLAKLDNALFGSFLACEVSSSCFNNKFSNGFLEALILSS